MALRDRIHSLETEYGVQYLTAGGYRPNIGAVVEALRKQARAAYGLKDYDFLANGSRLYHDVGHAEWALPECRSAYEAAVYDKAADHLLLHVLAPRVEAEFAQKGAQGRVAIFKNNRDSYGNTFGCHENYQMLRDADVLGGTAFVRYTAQCLVPFLVSRQILVGAGFLVTQPEEGITALRYELSQRAGIMQAVVSRDTTRHRAIFNLGREGEPHSDPQRFRRLHQILGDANLSGWATYIKLGTTGLMLRLIEDLYLDEVPVLCDPLEALRAISRDPGGTVPLQDGRVVRALDIQWMYYNAADAYLNLVGASDEDEALMELWGQALEDFGQDPLLLRNRADWAIKHHLLNRFLESQGRELESVQLSEQDLVMELSALNLRYHELSPQGLYCQLYPVDTLVQQAEILGAQEAPPPFTRARMRGTAIWRVRQMDEDVHANSWTGLRVGGEYLVLEDPLMFDHPLLVAWDQLPSTAAGPRAERKRQDAERLYRQGCAWYYAGEYRRALAVFEQAAAQDSQAHQYAQAVALTCLVLGRYDQAIRWFVRQGRLAGRAGEQEAANLVGLGNAFRLKGDMQRAMRAYRQATRTTTHQAARAYTMIGLMHVQRGEVRSAETCFRQALQRDPYILPALVGLGVILLPGAEAQLGRGLLQKALDLPAERLNRTLLPAAEAYFRAIAQLALGREEALDALQAALLCRAPEAAEGIVVLEPLLNVLAQVTPPIAALEVACAQAQGLTVQSEQGEASSVPVSLGWLRRALAHSSPEVRRAAARYAGWRLHDLPAGAAELFLGLLVERMQRDPDPAVRRAALRALGQPALQGTPAFEQVLACLHDPDPALRWAAQAALEGATLPGTPVTLLGDTRIVRGDEPPSPSDALRWLQRLLEEQGLLRGEGRRPAGQAAGRSERMLEDDDLPF